MKIRSRRSAVPSPRRGAGTLIFLAFMVLVFLVVIGLFQWFSRFITQSNKVFNEEAIARSLAESGVNEILCQFCGDVNNYPLASSTKIAEYSKFLEGNGGESCLTSGMATKLAKDPVSAGGYGLDRFPQVDVRIKAVNERHITDVDRRGLLQFSCKVTVGATTHTATRSFEYFRYLIIPPHRLGRFAFAAFNWQYYIYRYRAYLHSLLQHRVARAIYVAKIRDMYALKGGMAVEATKYADQVAGILKSSTWPVTIKQQNGPDLTYNSKGEALGELAWQLDGYHNQFVGATKTRTSAERTAPGDDGKFRGQFTIPYFIRMANGKPKADQLKGVSSKVEKILLDLDADTATEVKFRYRDKEFQPLTQFMPELKPPLPNPSTTAWAEGLCGRIKSEFDKFWEADLKLLRRSVPKPDGSAGTSPWPFYVEGHKRTRLFSEELEFNNVKIPTMGADGKPPTELTSYVPVLSIPPGDNGIQKKDGTAGMKGSCFFAFDPADLGMHPAIPSAGSATANPPAQAGTASRPQNLMTAAELAAVKPAGSAQTPPANSSTGGTPDERPNQTGFLGDEWDKMDQNSSSGTPQRDKFVDDLLADGQGTAFGSDLGQYERFETWWTAALEAFKKVHVEGGSMEDKPTGDTPPSAEALQGQIMRHKHFLKLASVDPEEPPPGVTLTDKNKIDNVKAVAHIGAGYQQKRSCFKFTTPQKFYEYIEKSLALDPPGVMKLSGLYFIESGDVVLPYEKYTGTGMISAAGNITVPKGIEKSSPTADGNLILIAGKDIALGGSVAQCAAIASGHLRTAPTGSSTTSSTAPKRLVIKGNLIVGDTATVAGGTVDEASADAVDFTLPGANHLPEFIIEWDEKLIDDKNCMLIVMCPYRTIQLVERKRGVFGRTETH